MNSSTIRSGSVALWTLTASLFALAGAAPVPQASSSEALPESSSVSVAPTSSTNDTSSKSSDDGLNSRQIYYIVAIAACATGILAFLMAYVRRKRRQQRQLLEGDTGHNELGFNNVRTAVPHQRQVKKRIVLSESQFDMLPRIIAQDSTKQSSNDADEKSKADGSFGVSSEVESCSICLCDITGGEELVSLIPCHHEFHVSCASQWLTQKSTMCPLCKADMLEGLGFKRPKSFGEDNDDIELVTIPASPNNAADTVSAAEPQTTAPPGPTPPAPVVTTTRQSRLID